MKVFETTGMLMNAKEFGIIPCKMRVQVERTAEGVSIALIPEGSAIGYLAAVTKEMQEELCGANIMRSN